MSPHRTPGPVDNRPDAASLHDGPRPSCPACGARDLWQCDICNAKSGPLPEGGAKDKTANCCPMAHCNSKALVGRVTAPRFCGPGQRFGSWWKPWRRCSIPGEHTHQSCTVCGASWVNAVLEPVGP